MQFHQMSAFASIQTNVLQTLATIFLNQHIYRCAIISKRFFDVNNLRLLEVCSLTSIKIINLHNNKTQKRQQDSNLFP